VVHEFVGRKHLVQEAHLERLFGREDAAGQQKVIGVGQADDARQQPGEAVFGREVEAAMRGGELCAGLGEAQIRERRQHKPDAGRGPVHRGDDRFSDAEVVGEGRVEARIDPEPGLGDVLADARIVAALFGVTLERAQIGAGAERVALRIAGHDDHPHLWVVVSLVEQPTVFGVHPAGPGVPPLGPGEGDRRDALADVVAGRLEVQRASST
jgi:hypothetical protein